MDTATRASEYRVRLVVFADGERVSMLLNSVGIPHWHATLFATTQVRNSNKAPNTLIAALSAVRMLLRWCVSQSLDLESRLASHALLSNAELESLRAFCEGRRPRRDSVSKPTKVRHLRANEHARASISRAPDRVSSGVQYIRITYIAKYLEWMTFQLCERATQRLDPGRASDVKLMTASFRALRPTIAGRSRLTSRRGMSSDAQVQLLEIVGPTSDENPFDPLVQERNELIVWLLFHLGIRAGELLALKVSDFDFQKNEVVVVRRHGDKSDPRRHQPVAKTLDRRLSLSNELAAAVAKYVLQSRRRIPGAKRHHFLLVTHKPGPHEGAPLSRQMLAKIFSTIRRSAPDALANVVPHVLRHTANDRFSEVMCKSRSNNPSLKRSKGSTSPE